MKHFYSYLGSVQYVKLARVYKISAVRYFPIVVTDGQRILNRENLKLHFIFQDKPVTRPTITKKGFVLFRNIKCTFSSAGLLSGNKEPRNKESAAARGQSLCVLTPQSTHSRRGEVAGISSCLSLCPFSPPSSLDANLKIS